MKTAHLAAAHAGLPGDLLLWARDNDLEDDEPLFFSRQRGADGQRRSIDRVRAWQIVKAASEQANIRVLALRASNHGRVGEPAPVHPHLFRHARVRQIVRHTQSLPLAQNRYAAAREQAWRTAARTGRRGAPRPVPTHDDDQELLGSAVSDLADLTWYARDRPEPERPALALMLHRELPSYTVLLYSTGAYREFGTQTRQAFWAAYRDLLVDAHDRLAAPSRTPCGVTTSKARRPPMRSGKRWIREPCRRGDWNAYLRWPALSRGCLRHPFISSLPRTPPGIRRSSAVCWLAALIGTVRSMHRSPQAPQPTSSHPPYRGPCRATCSAGSREL